MSIIKTKLHVPSTRQQSVPRPRLMQALDVGLPRKLTLVSAPAGFGKTTLISEWIAANNRPTAWLSLDTDDSEPIRFLTYVGTAIQTVAPEIGASILYLLESPTPPPIDSLLTTLLNKLSESSNDILLVLDDYHRLDNVEIDKALAFLIDNQPPQLHLIITTREDPRLPLARLRVRDELSEIRATDLRFSPDEAAEFLNQAMGLSLLADDITALATRTEGWIAGLQLAAISMQGQNDTANFIQSFTGSHHYVLDYLAEEVLNRQAQHIQVFLLKTSILNRMCASLCDAVLQDDDYPSQRLLEDIQQANLFLVPLDNERHWFRYHHLFADLLRKHLEQLPNTDANQLHIRASQWFEQHDLRAEAIYHALVAKDYDLAAEMIELEWEKSHASSFQSLQEYKWMQALPSSIYHNRPVLSAGFGWVLLNLGELDAADARLRDAERWLASSDEMETDASTMIVADKSAFQRLPATVASARMYHGLAIGDIPSTIQYGQQVLKLVDEQDHHQRGITTSMIGLAHWSRGDLATAFQFMSDGVEYMYKMGNVDFALSSTFGLADVRMGQGHLLDAIDIYKESMKVAQAQPSQVQGVADLYMGLGDLLREQNDLALAEEYLNKSEMLGEQAGLPDWRVRFYKLEARRQQTLGHLDRALDLLEKAEQLYRPTPVPNTRPIAAMKARIWIQQGQLNKALAWAQNSGLSLDSPVAYLSEYEFMTLVRIHIARIEIGNTDSPRDALRDLLERLLDTAEIAQRMGSVIEISILQARLQWVQDNRDVALTFLQRALQLAEPEGYVRIFVDEGRVMKTMLTEALSQEIFPAYSQKLLAAFENDSGADTSRTSQPLIEPLSERELEILQLVADGLSNREISKRLFIALNTVKGHNQNIYQKLQVKRRTEAVARARELGLI